MVRSNESTINLNPTPDTDSPLLLSSVLPKCYICRYHVTTNSIAAMRLDPARRRPSFLNHPSLKIFHAELNPNPFRILLPSLGKGRAALPLYPSLLLSLSHPRNDRQAHDHNLERKHHDAQIQGGLAFYAQISKLRLRCHVDFSPAAGPALERVNCMRHVDSVEVRRGRNGCRKGQEWEKGGNGNISAGIADLKVRIMSHNPQADYEYEEN
jgi:hypothetical protein